MKKVIYTLLIAGIAIMSVSCCATCRKASKVAMMDSRWLLTEINGKPVDRSSGSNAVIRYSLHLGENNRFDGLGGCNRFFGQYTINTKDRTVTFGEGVGVSKMMCSDQAGEDEYLKMITAAKSYDLDGGYLILKDENLATVAIFRQDDSEIGKVEY